MTANELMIGDIVKYKSCKCYTRITEICDDGSVRMDGNIHYFDVPSCFEGVPLTNSLMKQFHFKYSEVAGYFIKDEGRLKDGELYFIDSEGYDCKLMEIKYLHQLQHLAQMMNLDIEFNYEKIIKKLPKEKES